MPVKTHKALFDLVYTGFCETPETRCLCRQSVTSFLVNVRGTRNEERGLNIIRTSFNLVRVALALAIPGFAKDHGNEVVQVSWPCVGNMVATRE